MFKEEHRLLLHALKELKFIVTSQIVAMSACSLLEDLEMPTLPRSIYAILIEDNNEWTPGKIDRIFSSIQDRSRLSQNCTFPRSWRVGKKSAH